MKARWILSAAALSAAPACNELADIQPGTLDTSETVTDTTSESTSSTGGSTGSTSTSEAMCELAQTRPCYTGAEGTAGVGVCKAGSNACEDGQWDTICQGEVLPATEICSDGTDNNCDGKIDEGCSCGEGTQQDCYSFEPGTAGIGACKTGLQTCTGDTWGPCVGELGPTAEVCDNPGVDDDCNGVQDDIVGLGVACDTGLKGVCIAGKMDCVIGILECEQQVPSVPESCDGLDNDCNGLVDDVSGACTINLPAGGQCGGSLGCVGNSTVCSPFLSLVDDFASGVAWGLTGEWEIGPTFAGGLPAVGNPDPPMDHSPTADNKVAGVKLGGDASTSPHGPDYLTSKVLSTNNAGGLYLTYYRYLNTNASPDMLDTIEVSVDGGGTWSQIWQNGATPVYESGWSPISLDITPYKSSTFRVRFGVTVLTSGPSVSSWNIDDVVIGSCPIP